MEQFYPEQPGFASAGAEKRAERAVPAGKGSRLFVFGGEEVSVDTFDEVAVHDPSTDRWVTLPAMPAGRFGPGTAAIADAIYVAAGGPEPGPGSFSGILEILVFGAG